MYHCRGIGRFYSSFPIVLSFSISPLETSRRPECRLLRQMRFLFLLLASWSGSFLGRLKKTLDWAVAQSEHSCCRHGDVAEETTRRARALRMRRRAVSQRSVRRSSIRNGRVSTQLTVFTQEPTDCACVRVEGPFKGSDYRF